MRPLHDKQFPFDFSAVNCFNEYGSLVGIAEEKLSLDILIRQRGQK